MAQTCLRCGVEIAARAYCSTCAGELAAASLGRKEVNAQPWYVTYDDAISTLRRFADTIDADSIDDRLDAKIGRGLAAQYRAAADVLAEVRS